MARGSSEADYGPFLKWAGGKGALLDDYEPLYPRDIQVYHEPFLGAGAVFFRLAESGRIKKAHLSDVNEDLVLAFRMVKSKTAELIEALTLLRRAHSEERYYAERERFNRRETSPLERAALVIYLNKTGYNGLYRVNSRDEFNVPFGRYKEPRVFNEKLLWAAADRLKRATIEARDFKTVIERAKPGDFVYFNPPYEPLNRTAYFTGYATGGFRQVEQERLARVFRQLDARGVRAMLSNHDMPLIRKLYDGFSFRTLQVTRAINSKGARRATPVAEIVVRNYES